MSNVFFAKVDFESLVKSKKKGVTRMMQITDSAIELIYKEGLENFSYEKLSKTCGISRSLIYLYFPNLSDFLIFMSTYIRYKYQVFVISKMQDKSNDTELLRAYVSGALQWVDVTPIDVAIWMIYFHKCAVLPKLAEHHSQLVDIGKQRIQAILNSGIEKGHFDLSPNKTEQIARTIQLLITGFIVSRVSEKRTKQEWDHELNLVVQTCMDMASALQ
jgi:AcrR family transcriptional regulator